MRPAGQRSGRASVPVRCHHEDATTLGCQATATSTGLAAACPARPATGGSGCGRAVLDLVFTWPDGRPLHPDLITDWFQRHAKRVVWEQDGRTKVGLPAIRLHDVRHSYATAALAAGIPAKIVSERLGHANVQRPGCARSPASSRSTPPGRSPRAPLGRCASRPRSARLSSTARTTARGVLGGCSAAASATS
jgi:hypothetical protein